MKGRETKRIHFVYEEEMDIHTAVASVTFGTGVMTMGSVKTWTPDLAAF